MGADDYIYKPFSHRLLIARIRAVLRRAESRLSENDDEGAAPAERIVRGRLEMDPARHRVTWAGRDVALTVTEFMILEALAQRPGFVKSRDQLMDAAHPDDVSVDGRPLATHLNRLPKKFTSAHQSFKTT